MAQTQVRGDLIIVQSDRILTRSRSKQSECNSCDEKVYLLPNFAANFRPDPDQYTIIPASLKILKVLIEDLLSASGVNAAANLASAAANEFHDAEDDDGDEGWEDAPDDTLDLSLASTKNDLMGWLDGNSQKARDDETQAYLTEFFLRAARENIAGFQDWFAMLTDDEKAKLQELAAQ